MPDIDKEFLIRVRADMQQALTEFRRIRGELTDTRRSATRAASGTDALARSLTSLRRIAAGLISIDLARRIIGAADAYRVLQQRIRALTEETGDYNRVSAEIARISRENSVALGDTAGSFQRIQISAAALGATNQDILRLVDLIQKLGRIGGSTQQQLAAGSLQFAQALAAGVVRAEEINSVIENLPLLAKRIEEGLGLLPGQLRNAVIEGKVFSRDVLRVILEQGSDIDEQFSRIPKSIEDTSTNLGISLAEFFGKLDEAVGLTQEIAEGLKAASEAIDTADAERLLEILKAIAFAAGSLAAARLFGPALASAGALATALGAVNGRLLLVQAGTTAWNRALLTLKGTMALLGGPGGLIILAASAIAYFALKAREASQENQDFIASVQNLTASARDLVELKYTEALQRILEVSRAIDDLEEKQAKSTLSGRNARNNPYERRLRELRSEEAGLRRAIDQLERRLRELDAEAQGSGETTPPPARTPEIDLSAARAEAESRLLQDRLEEKQRQLDASLDQNLISYRAYYSERARLQTEALDAEIRAAQTALAEQRRETASETEDEAIQTGREREIRLETELALLRARRARIAEVAAADEARAEQGLAEEKEQIQIRLLEAQGRTAAARGLAITASYREAIDRLKAEGDADGVELVNKLINVETARARLDELQADFDRTVQRMNETEQRINAERDAGLITEREARERIVAVHKETQQELEALIPKMRELAAAIGPEAVEAVESYADAIKGLGVVTDEVAQRVNNSVKNNLSDAIYDFARGAEDAKSAFRSFADSVIADITRIASENIADALLGGFGGAGSSFDFGAFISGIFGGGSAATAHTGGIAGQLPATRRVSPLAFARAPRFHSGGIAGLAPDEIPIIARRGEEILPASDPRHRDNSVAAPPSVVQHINLSAIDGRDLLARLDEIKVELFEMQQQAAGALNIGRGPR